MTQPQRWPHKRIRIIIAIILFELACIILYKSIYFTKSEYSDFDIEIVENPDVLNSNTSSNQANDNQPAPLEHAVEESTVFPSPLAEPPKRARQIIKTTMLLLYPTSNNTTPFKDKPLCPDTRSHPGNWSTREFNPNPSNASTNVTIPFWEPYQCQYHAFTRTQLGQCLLDRHIVVSGDSLIRNMLTTILQHIDPDFNWDDPVMHQDAKKTIPLMDFERGELMGYVGIHFLWTPSVWFFTPKWTGNGGADVSYLRPKGSLDNPIIKGDFPGDQRAATLYYGEETNSTDSAGPIDSINPTNLTNSTELIIEFEQLPIFDTIALSMGVWDLGEYNLGLSPYYLRLIAVLHDTLSNVHFKTTPPSWPNPKLYFYDIHKMYNGYCKTPICQACNTDLRQRWWREAQRGARVCLPHYYGKMNKIEVIDNYDMTDTELARSNTPDGIHYADGVAFMQAMVWVNGLCDDWLRHKSALYEERTGTVDVEVDADDTLGHDACLEVEGVDENAILGQCVRLTY